MKEKCEKVEDSEKKIMFEKKVTSENRRLIKLDIKGWKIAAIFRREG